VSATLLSDLVAFLSATRVYLALHQRVKMVTRLDKKFLTIALVITLVATYRMYEVAKVTGNWKGLYFSIAHIVVVVIGVMVAIGFKEHKEG
jgi:hypothetical protein